MVGTLLLCLARLAFVRGERAVNCGRDNKHQSWPSFCVLVVVVLVFLLLLNDKSKITTGQQANIKYGDGTQHNTAEQSTAQQNTTRCNPTRQRGTRGRPSCPSLSKLYLRVWLRCPKRIKCPKQRHSMELPPFLSLPLPLSIILALPGRVL